jgi:tetrahydromethanopterin S-methyltransferase subunit G
MTTVQRVSRLEGAYEQVDARLHDIGQAVESSRSEMNSRFAEVNGTVESLRSDMNARFAEVNTRFNTLMVIMIGSWVTTILAIIGLYFTRFVE